MGFTFTKHGLARAQQRGIKPDLIETLLGWGDEVPVGGGAVSIALGSTGAEELLAEGVLPARVDRLRDLAVVVSRDGDIVTCMVLRKSGRGKRRYRHGLK